MRSKQQNKISLYQKFNQSFLNSIRSKFEKFKNSLTPIRQTEQQNGTQNPKIAVRNSIDKKTPEKGKVAVFGSLAIFAVNSGLDRFSSEAISTAGHQSFRKNCGKFPRPHGTAERKIHTCNEKPFLIYIGVDWYDSAFCVCMYVEFDIVLLYGITQGCFRDGLKYSNYDQVISSTSGQDVDNFHLESERYLKKALFIRYYV